MNFIQYREWSRNNSSGTFTLEMCVCTPGANDVNTVQEQQLKMNVGIERTAEALDQHDRTGACSLPDMSIMFPGKASGQQVDVRARR